MSTSFTFSLPVLPVSANNYLINVPGRGRVLSAEAKVFKLHASNMAAAAARAAGWQYHAGDRLALAIYLTPADKRRWDLDGKVKILQDAIAEALGFDDTCIDWLKVGRFYNGGGAEMTFVTVGLCSENMSYEMVVQAGRVSSVPPGATTLIGEQLLAGLRQVKEHAKATREKRKAAK